MIKLENINKTYIAGDTEVKALVDVSLCFRENEFVSVLGPSGCGKTTLLNILGGLDRYDSGDILVNESSTKDFKSKDWDAYRNHYIGFVFQNYNLIPHLSVVENVELALSIGGTKKREKRKLALDALSKVGLKAQAKKKPNQLSGGQMQRVAIARAIVNNPEVILADEPTGALDSETSIQVMNILKEIAKDRLVIMVTHNKELAESYSTRIINMLDGKIVSDSMPFTSNKTEVKKQNVKKKKSAMSIFTAFALSFKNLFSKKLKTFLVSFAGSIGIIGIALILAVSTGMTNYVNNLQSTTLSGYPVSISTVTIDMDVIEDIIGNIGSGGEEGGGSGGGSGSGSGGPSEEKPDKDLDVYDITKVVGKLGKFNYLSEDFISYILSYKNEDDKKDVQDRTLESLRIEYSTDLKLLSKVNDNVIKVDTSVSQSTLSGTTKSNFFQGLDNKDYVLSNYKLVYGEYPQDKSEICLIIDSSGNFSIQTLASMGFEYGVDDKGNYTNLKYSNIVGKEYKLVFNDDYYIADNAENPTRFTTAETNLDLYNNANNLTLKISGILQVKDDANSQIFDSGIMYLPELTEYCLNKNKQSLIARKTLENQTLYMPYVVDVSEMKNFLGTEESVFKFNTPQEIMTYAKGFYNQDLTLEQTLELALQMVGASSIPTNIALYTNSFNSKTQIVKYIEDWNSTELGQNNKILHTDSTEMLTSSLGTLINVISYILIAFASISLVVSSVMIGIITYTSVVERTKEIGVLRSIGARKKDISRVFNMETFIIGLTSGLIGVLTTFILTFPISAIIKNLAGGGITGSLAILKFSHMIGLVVISVVLTFIAGLIPAFIASKKDPVKALRYE